MAAGFYDLFSLLYHWFAGAKVRATSEGGVTTGGESHYKLHHKFSTSGGIQVFNCADYSHKITLIPKFPLGSFAYIKKDAIKGILTKIYIKKVRFIPYVNKWTPIVLTPLYVDLNNALYNEQELCTSTEAEALIAIYLQKYKAALEDNLKNC